MLVFGARRKANNMRTTKNRPALPADVLHALASAERSQGWNVRAATVRRFNLAGGCRLYVVPARAWTYRCAEQRAVTPKPNGFAA
jgi:hypothetical protein